MGRPRTPAALNVFNGNPSKRPLRKPVEVKGKAECPKWLDDYAKETWKRWSPIAERLGVLTAADEGAFAALCQAFAEMKAAMDDIKEHGRNLQIPIQTRDGEILGYDRKANPAVKQLQAATESYRRLAVEFCMTAISRTRLEKTDDEADELEEFLKGKRKIG
jgi:P27 family predicted phage terminase small subunit